MMKTTVSLLAGLLIATAAAAQDTIRIDHAASHSMVPGARVGDGYLVITNGGSAPDRLVGARSERAGSVQLHQMTMANGIMTMRELKGGLAIPAGQTVTLEPNYHLMFQDVAKPFKQGETIRAVLRFEKAGEIAVDFAVGRIAGPLDDVGGTGAGMDHGSMPGMDGMDMDGPPPQEAIPAVLKTMFERPDKPLTVLPVVVRNGFAIAGWQQDGRGGRALMKQGHHGWSLVLCSGDAIRQAAALEKAGLSAEDAAALSADLAAAEAGLDPEVLALFASFEGTVTMAAAADGAGQGGHEGHGQ
ncbi:copper uptake system-associated protein [Rhizobium sp. GCM10022189]|uniref:copper uptake system-associated protein n=1 Tax=Rhizobium sp. GCM10022189 TaxID=3252654 RepID=UPI003617BF4B